MMHRYMIRSKKGMEGPAIFGIILGIIIILLIIYLAVINSRGCNDDTDCPEYHYCGSDFECHEHKTIEKEVQDLVMPSAILGISIIIAAMMLRIKIKKKDRRDESSRISRVVFD